MRQVRDSRGTETQWRSCTDTWHYIAGSFTISEDSKPRVINLDFPALPSGNGRSQKLIENGAERPLLYACSMWKLIRLDAFLASVLDLLSPNMFTVIYTTTPPNAAHQPASAESESYEMDAQFQVPVHMDLKRDFSNHKRASDGNITLPDGPLFERYQYLSPGISPFIPGKRLLMSLHTDYSVQVFSWVYLSPSSLSPSSTLASTVLPASRSLMLPSTRRWVPQHRRSSLSNVFTDCKLLRQFACMLIGIRDHVYDVMPLS